MTGQRRVNVRRTTVSRLESVIHTRSTVFKVSPIRSGSRGVKEGIVSIATRGFRLSILDLAASTLYNHQWVKDTKNYPQITLLPTSESWKKNPAPRSSSDTFSSSMMINLPIPARTIFLIVSVAVPLRFTTRIVAFRILNQALRINIYI